MNSVETRESSDTPDSQCLDSQCSDSRMSAGAAVAHRAIRLYQLLTQHRPTPCRYVPTCSHYGLQALEVHGLVRGGWMTVRRLGRCTPWASRSGWDPVPPPTGARRQSDAVADRPRPVDDHVDDVVPHESVGG